MAWFMNLGFRWKIALPLLILVLLFITIGFFGITTSQRIADDAQTIGKVFLKQVDYLLQADRDLYQSYLAEQRLIYVDATDKDILKQHEENAQQAYDRTLMAIDLGMMDDEAARREDFLERFAAWKDVTDKVVGLARQGNIKAAEQLGEQQGHQAFEHLRDLIDVIQERQIALADAFTRQAREDSQQVHLQLLLGLGAGLVVCILLIIFIPPMIARPIDNISQRVAEIAMGEGDLTLRVPAGGNDEIAALGKNFNAFVEKLHNLVVHIRSSAEKVSSNSVELSGISETNRSAIQSQNVALDMVVSAVHEMSVAIREVAQNTNETADQARNASQRSDTGLAMVEDTVAKIQHVASQVNDVSGLVEQVEQQVTSVTTVLDVIRGIAEQTNLLALNAAIEAARAGEQGRGFAVVADEVRTLASRTQESTTDIQNTLERLQSSVASAAEAMRAGSESADITVVTANEAGGALGEINEAVSSIADMAVQIATAVEQQTAVIEDINRNLTEIHDQGATAGHNAERTNQASRELGVAAADLMHDIGSFKL